MIVSKLSFFCFLIFIFFVVITTWIAIQSLNYKFSNSTNPDTFIINQSTNVTYHDYTPEGVLLYRGYTDVLRRQQDGVSLLDRAKMTIYSEDKTVWHIKALHAKIYAKNTQIDLWGDVVIIKEANVDKKSPPLEADTQAATFYPKTHSIHSDKYVLIKELGTRNTMSGIGLDATTQPIINVKLHANIKTYYADPVYADKKT